MPNNGWTRQELLVAFGLYCQVPFGKISSRNLDIIRYAALIGRTASALSMKMANIASLDPEITGTERKGLSRSAKADRLMWEEMTNNWRIFVPECANVMISLLQENNQKNPDRHEKDTKQINYFGEDKQIQTTARVGQDFFRRSVLSAYNNKCCITGLIMPKLLVASHIVPWSESEDDRLNPRNGLALSVLHDKAFDLGLITIERGLVRVSQNIDERDDYFNSSIKFYDGKKIVLPEKFHPEENFLEFHREKIFEKWLRE